MILFQFYVLLLQQSLQLCSNCIANLGCVRRATNIPCPNALVDDNLDSLINLLCEIRAAQGVLEHHADGKESRDGVADTLACNIGCRACAEISTKIQIFQKCLTHRGLAHRYR